MPLHSREMVPPGGRPWPSRDYAGRARPVEVGDLGTLPRQAKGPAGARQFWGQSYGILKDSPGRSGTVAGRFVGVGLTGEDSAGTNEKGSRPSKVRCPAVG